MAEDLDLGLDVKETIFRRRQKITARQKVADDGLGVSAEERPARMKRLAEEIVRARGFGGTCGSLDRLIVGGDGKAPASIIMFLAIAARYD
jgi:hypothetical protein